MISKSLLQIPDPPKQIYVLGKLPEDESPKIAIVGTRKASTYGYNIATQLASELANFGFIIVSGLAMGIDTAAHKGCLSAGGRTIAVLPNGLDKIYPAQNENLAKSIIDQEGALISEYPNGTPTYKDNFLRRNRLISGLCLGVIIIEAPQRSGSLSTASHAAEQGREVFVIPGPINHPNFAGSHALLRDGCRLVSSTKDIIEDLKMENTLIVKSRLSQPTVNLDEEKIIETFKMSAEPLSLDKIAELTKLEPKIISQSLSRLILSEIINEKMGRYELK